MDPGRRRRVAKVGRLGGLKSGLDVVIKQMRLPVTQVLASYSFNSSSSHFWSPPQASWGLREITKTRHVCACLPRTGESRLSEGEPFRLPPS